MIGTAKLTTLLLLIIINHAYSLVPVESLLLGDIAQFEEERKRDPVNYIFRNVERIEDFSKNLDKRRRVAYLRSLVQQGITLKNYCKDAREIEYTSSWHKSQVARATASALQWIGLDFSTKAIAKYADYFKFSKSEYENLVNDLISNKCSQNITVISIDQLKKNMLSYYDSVNDNDFYKLPSIKNDPFLSPKLDKFISEEKWMEREFLYTVDIFRNMCSWGLSTENYRLMSMYLRDPFIMSLVINQMSSNQYYWNEKTNENFLIKDENTVKVNCENLICRKVDQLNFDKNFIRSLGSISVKDDLSRLYCSEFRVADFRYKTMPAELANIAKSYSFEEMYLNTSHFVSLITAVPNFFLRMSSYSEGDNLARANLDTLWDRWAKDQNDFYSRDLYFEEPLSIEVVDRKFYFDRSKSNFSVHFDINMGEFDRISQLAGKVGAYFNLNISRPFLKWVRLAITGRDPKKQNMPYVRWRLKIKIEDALKEVHNKFLIKPWHGDISDLLVDELLVQLSNYKGEYFLVDVNEMYQIPIHFNFGPFALKYIRYEYFHIPNKISGKLKKRRGELVYK
ncbi:MAG: hypothetical protein H6622_05285 [Halobacteriovoraceae bacterium]|nr:hypothetical protein [Halobacteriovoraceae bacterium]